MDRSIYLNADATDCAWLFDVAGFLLELAEA